MSIPKIRVAEIEAGLQRLVKGRIYDVPALPHSAVYRPETSSLRIEIAGTTYTVRKGGLAALPRGTAHRLHLDTKAAGPFDTLAPPFKQVLASPPANLPGNNIVFCARVPTAANPLPDVVPEILLLSKQEMRKAHRLDDTFDLLRHHALSDGPNRQIILRRLAEICATIFLEIILGQYKRQGIDLHAAAKDVCIRAVLNAIHADASRKWDLQSLGAVAGLSRSSFIERFKASTGHTPLAYLANFRISLAAGMLREQHRTIAEIAHSVGYDTDSAFAKAFRRHMGQGPAAYRSDQH